MKCSQRCGIICCGCSSLFCLGVFVLILLVLPIYRTSSSFVPTCEHAYYNYISNNTNIEIAPFCTTCSITKTNAVEFAEADTLAKTLCGIAFCLFVFMLAITLVQFPSLWRRIKERRVLHYVDFSTSGKHYGSLFDPQLIL